MLRDYQLMEPIHPAEEMNDLRVGAAIIGILLLIILIQISAGHWDEIFAHAVAYFPLWRWGG